jgi:Ca-activated chloride channel family protein
VSVESPVSFASPWLLLSLVLLAGVVGLWMLAERRRARYAVRYTNVDVLAAVAAEGRSWPRLVSPVLFLVALALLLFALGRPHVERMVLKERATVILVIDTSRSMQAEDVPPTRLVAAQEALRDFLDQVPDRLNVGLVVFAGEAQVATPPTTDHELVEDSVDEIDTFLIYGGTAIGDALQTAVELAKQSVGEPPEGQEIALGDSTTRHLAQAVDCDDESPASILFLSDGSQTRGILQPLEGAALAQDACIPVYTVALGTPEGSIDRGSFGGPFGPGSPGDRIPVPPDPETLRAIAEMTGGQFTEARTPDALEGAYSKLSSKLGREPGQVEVTFLFVALAGAFLLLSGAVATFLSPRLP